MAIITPHDLEVNLGLQFTDDQFDQCQSIIDDIQGEMEAYLFRTVEIHEYTAERYVTDIRDPRIFLRNTPVISIESVNVDGVPIQYPLYTPQTWGLDFAGFNTLAIADPVIFVPSASNFAYTQHGDVYVEAAGGYPQSIWTVNYHAGWDGLNIPALQNILKKAVRRELAAISEGFAGLGVNTRIQDEDFTVQKNERLILAMVGSFTPGEIAILQRYRRKNLVTT